MENRDPMSYKEQEATRKLLAAIEDVIAECSTSFSIAKNVDRLMTEYRKEWPR
jgi:hypothetical protein